jgi:hypothetical protein
MATPRRLAAVLLSAALLLPLPAVTAAADPANLAVGRPITASSTIGNFVAAKANDDDPTTYWEAAPGTYPNTLTVALGANANLTSVGLRLNPAPEWGARVQTVEVLGRDQSGTGFTSLSPATPYTFDPATGNAVTIPLTAEAADVQLRITSNTGGSGGQVAEFQVHGTPAPNPDLTVSAVTTSPATPVETDDTTATATITNVGTLASAETTNVTFYLGTDRVATTQVGPVGAGASTTISARLGRHDAGTYPLVAKVDEAGQVFERDETNNSRQSTLTVTPVRSADLVPVVTWTPETPEAGAWVRPTVTIRNQGTSVTAGIVQFVSVDFAGSPRFGVHVGRIPAGGTSGPLPMGGFRAPANGKYAVRATVTPDANEVPIKRPNNTNTQDLYVGRGAAMPYDTYEAEDGVLGGGTTVVGPNRTIGDLAGEASGRRAVTLGAPGSSVEFTTRHSTNTLVARVSVPDGTEGTIGIRVDGRYVKDLTVTSKYAWLYGPETGPVNDPTAGPPRHIYDEANTMLGVDVPAGAKIKLVRGSVPATVDFVSVEQVTPVANPDPKRYLVPNGSSQQALQDTLDKVRTDITGTLVGVYLPPGDYENSTKVRVDGTVKVVGAGPWFTRFHAPADADNTDAGFAVTANGSSFTGFSYWGNWKTRIDGPGKVFDLANVTNLTFDDLWVEHTVVAVWGTHIQDVTVKDSRIRDTFADAVNLTNGSTRNHVVNNEARTTGDDSFALFAATDLGGGDQRDNLFEHLTATTPWRAAGVAAYGGQANTFRDIHVADTLAGPGLTVSSLSFGITMRDFGPAPTTFKGVTLERAGGHFFGAQTFPAVWLFSATTLFRGIRFDHVRIKDPTYSGIMFQTNYVNGNPVTPITDTEFTDVTVAGAHRSGDQFDARSGLGVWANELPEPGQGPAVGSASFRGLRLYDNAVDIRNTTTTFTISRS